MKFQNKRENMQTSFEEKYMENAYTRGTIKDPTEFEKSQIERANLTIGDIMNPKSKIDILKDKVAEIKAPVVAAVVPYDDQMIFWNYLNDIQYGQFKKDELTKANTWLVTKTGTWLIQKNRTGYYGVKKSDKGISTLPASKEYPSAFFDLEYGKIPNDLLLKVVAFFRDIMKRYNDAEAFIQIYWDKTESRYIIHVPKQRISKGSVNYDALENLDNIDRDRYVFAYECHSHNSMGAFWSGTDDRDEKELRIYGVFGQLDKDAYANKHRFFVGEEMIDVDISLVFDLPKEEEKKYLVTHNQKQYLVTGDRLLLDDKPKYVFENDKGEKFHVPLDSVAIQKTKVEFPEGWFKSINVPFISETKYESNFIQGRYNKGNGGGLDMPMFPSKGKKEKEGSDPFFFRDETKGYGKEGVEETEESSEIDPDYEMMAFEISQITSDLCQITTDFEEPEATFAFLESVAQNLCLKNLEKGIENFYVRIRQLEIEEGPSDGRY
jgi:PRTRC genetic system protein A